MYITVRKSFPCVCVSVRVCACLSVSVCFSFFFHISKGITAHLLLPSSIDNYVQFTHPRGRSTCWLEYTQQSLYFPFVLWHWFLCSTFPFPTNSTGTRPCYTCQNKYIVTGLYKPWVLQLPNSILHSRRKRKMQSTFSSQTDLQTHVLSFESTFT